VINTKARVTLRFAARNKPYTYARHMITRHTRTQQKRLSHRAAAPPCCCLLLRLRRILCVVKCAAAPGCCCSAADCAAAVGAWCEERACCKWQQGAARAPATVGGDCDAPALLPACPGKRDHADGCCLLCCWLWLRSARSTATLGALILPMLLLLCWRCLCSACSRCGWQGRGSGLSGGAGRAHMLVGRAHMLVLSMRCRRWSWRTCCCTRLPNSIGGKRARRCCCARLHRCTSCLLS